MHKKPLQSSLPLLRVAEIVECVCKYDDGISQNLQGLSPYWLGPPVLFSFLQIMVKQVKSSIQINQYQRVNPY